MADKFSAGDQVIVSSDFFWATGATGTVGVPPPQIIAVSDSWESDGLTRLERSASSVNTVCFVYFDEPQLDADGDGPYRGGHVWASALTRAS